jgi:hypothetical protein
MTNEIDKTLISVIFASILTFLVGMIIWISKAKSEQLNESLVSGDIEKIRLA